MGILDELLSQNLNEIDDLPTYEAPPNGTYRLSIVKCEEKMVDTQKQKNVPVLDIGYKITEVLELTNEEEREEVKENHEFNESYFFLDDKKKTMEAIATTFREVAIGLGIGNQPLNALVPMLKDLSIFATVKRRKDKNDDTKTYAQVRNARLA